MISPAWRPCSRMSTKISRSSVASGPAGMAPSRAMPAPEFTSMDVRGWVISWAIEAISSPTRARREAWARSRRAARSSSSACLRSVMSRQE